MKHVFIIGGIVSNVYLNSSPANVPAGAIAVDDATVVYQGWIANTDENEQFDGTFTAPEKDLLTEKEKSLEAVNSNHALMLRELTGDATIEERDTWTIQVDAAEKYLASLSGTPDSVTGDFLAGLLTEPEKAAVDLAGGDYATEMANKITTKSDNTKILIKMAGKVKRTADHAIEISETISELETAMDDFNASMATLPTEFVSAIS